MTARREPDQLIRAFLAEGTTELPDRAFDAVRRDLHRTRQRVVIGRWREPDGSVLRRAAIATGVVVALGLAWVNFGPSPGTGPGTQATPSASASPSASPSSSVAPPGDDSVPPGRYRFGVIPSDSTPVRLVITAPSGWSIDSPGLITKNHEPTPGLGIFVWQVNGAITDPCSDHTIARPTAQPGPAGIDALAEALSSQPGTSAKPPTAVTIDGYSGKLVELTVTAEISRCGNGLEGFHIWSSADGDQRYVQGNNETNRIWILDVEGNRFTFEARIPAAVTAADRAELEAMIQSIDIEPAVP